MAAATFIPRKPVDIEQLLADRNFVSGSDPSGNIPSSYYTSRLSYKGEIQSEIESKNLKEKIEFIIDCYTVIYEKLGAIETRIETLETQNKEILSLLAKNEEGVIHLIGSNFVEIDTSQMKEKLIEYHKEHKIVDPEKFANEFNFDLMDVLEVISQLIDEGLIEEVD